MPIFVSVLKAIPCKRRREQSWASVLHYTSPGPPGCDTNSTMFSLFVEMLHLRKAAVVFASACPAFHLQEFQRLVQRLLAVRSLASPYVSFLTWALVLTCVCLDLYFHCRVTSGDGTLACGVSEGRKSWALLSSRPIFFQLLNGDTTENPQRGITEINVNAGS